MNLKALLATVAAMIWLTTTFVFVFVNPIIMLILVLVVVGAVMAYALYMIFEDMFEG